MLNLKKEFLHHKLANPECKCISCNMKIEMATSADGKDEMPEEGNISVCIFCGSIAKFDKNLCVVPLDEGELQVIELLEPESYYLLMDAVRLIKERNHGQSGQA